MAKNKPSARIDMVKTNTIKSFVIKVLKFKASQRAADRLRTRFNALMKDTLKEAVRIAKKGKRKTIMPRDIKPAMEKIVGRKNLNAEDIAEEIKNLGAIELADLAKLVSEQIRKEKASAKRK